MSNVITDIRSRAKREWEQLEALPRIRVGTALCGNAAGATKVLNAIKNELSLQGIQANVHEVGCLGQCFAEPLVDIKMPGGPRVFYRNVTPESIPELIATCLINQKHISGSTLGSLGDAHVQEISRMEELDSWRHQVRIATRNAGTIDPGNISHYIAQDGYSALAKALTEMTPEQVLEQVAKSGLRGRGGAAFPTATKWGFLARPPGAEKYILVNCEEGDPGAFNDKGILESDPNTVIEGAILAAYATGATFGYVFIRHGHDGPIKRTENAISQARDFGLLGKSILGTEFSFDMEVSLVGESYVSGEETALMEAIEGKRAMPRFRPPFPAQSGLWGKPTNINNVKTLAYIPEIIRQGGEWFAGIGHGRSTGTAVLCLSGEVVRPGMYEVPFGLSLGAVIDEIGGGVPNGQKVKLLQTGGPLGGVLGPQSMEIILDFEQMAQAGAILGSGGIIIGGESVCAVDLVRNLVAFCQFESCGKCFPCRLGMTHLVDVLDRISSGEGMPADQQLMESMGKSMALGSLCGHGQLGFNPVSSALRYFAEEFQTHIQEHRCPAERCSDFMHKPNRPRPLAIGGWYAR